MSHRTRTWAITALLVTATTPAAVAQLRWRVSVKVVLDENNMRAVDGWFPGCCDLNTDAEIQAKIDTANDLLRGSGRGYQFDLTEIVDLADLPAPPASVKSCDGGDNDGEYCTSNADCDGGGTCEQVDYWFYAPVKREVRNALRDAAQADSSTYAWRDNAVNIYILGSDGSGTAFDMVLLGQDLAAPNTPYHELGHFFDLTHTFGPCNGCGESCDDPNAEDDGFADTLPDSPCWGSGDADSNGTPDGQDLIANNSFGMDYNALNASQQAQVDLVFFNVMCYRGVRERLSPDQLDHMTDHSNGPVNHVATGETFFVDAGGSAGDGSSSDPYETVAEGLGAAGPGDIVLIRVGSYSEVLTINQNVYLRGSRGNALIGVAP